MGSWQLEVFRMAVYISIPVAMFYLFNNPEYYEESVMKVRRKLCPPVDEENVKRFEGLKEKFRRAREKQIEEEFMKLN